MVHRHGSSTALDERRYSGEQLEIVTAGICIDVQYILPVAIPEQIKLYNDVG